MVYMDQQQDAERQRAIDAARTAAPCRGETGDPMHGVDTYRPEPDDVPFTQLEGEERKAAAREAFRRLHEQNRELMDRLSRR